MKRRLLSILLAAVMLLSAVPLGVVETAWAAGNSGSCGESVTWSLSSDGTLTLSGKGPHQQLWGVPKYRALGFLQGLHQVYRH